MNRFPTIRRPWTLSGLPWLLYHGAVVLATMAAMLALRAFWGESGPEPVESATIRQWAPSRLERQIEFQSLAHELDGDNKPTPKHYAVIRWETRDGEAQSQEGSQANSDAAGG